MKFSETEVLTKTPGYTDRFVKKTIEIKWHPDNICGEEGLKLSNAWNRSTSLLRHHNTHTRRENPKKTQRRTSKTGN
jgi:hypothetical protein